MQPLVSPVDHESRQNSYRADANEADTTEGTPLLHRFPHTFGTERNPVTTAVVSTLIIILITGVIIGIYLLILQNNSENILPPFDTPLKLVSRTQWDPKSISPVPVTSTFKASEVIIVQTDTEQCYTTEICERLLQKMETVEKSNYLPYNFLLSSDGQMYEALGWHLPSPLFPEYSNTALVLAFIGNFSQIPPTKAQITEAKIFFVESVRRQYLDSNFTVIGKKTKDTPKYIYMKLKDIVPWNSELSDTI